MKIITGNRGSGKTTALIEESAKTGAYIVVAHHRLAIFTANKARELRLDIPFPLTFAEFLNGRYRNKTRPERNLHILIDDVELLVQYLSEVPIDGITVNLEEEHHMHLDNDKKIWCRCSVEIKE